MKTYQEYINWKAEEFLNDYLGGSNDFLRVPREIGFIYNKNLNEVYEDIDQKFKKLRKK